ncbi:programmed cell death protein 7-like [Diachasma alloeum]|uniref:programmed cell death protein 7-like n=1 Tax=Diachasma alloeum TaxID=454923 RepID=UPI00073815AF|nr:programmed cell death protein 7-like [Diachasma alloeum]
MYPSHFVQPPPPFRPFVPQQPSPSTSDISFLNSSLNQRKIDTEFFENFANACTSSKKCPTKNHKKRLGISETRQLISSVKSLTISLEDSTNILRTNKNSPDFDWNLKLEKCKALKSQIENCMKKLKENEEICEFKKMIEQRRKKRMRIKRRNEAWKSQKSSREERRSNLHKEIDNWIRSKQEMIEREKQEENLKKDADLVLSDVRGKRSDAKRYLNVLRELGNLRRVKTANARARGENLSSAADESFERIISGLIEHWSQLDREYSIEEQGLKLMLQSDNERVIDRRKRSGFDEWEIAIFGRKLGNSRAGGDLGQLMTRFAWDRFIDGRGGRIPLGWVMPEPPSSGAWQKCLKSRGR